MMRRFLFSLPLLLCMPSTGHALPRWVELHVTPYLGLNTRLTIQANFTTPPQWITFHVQSLGAGRVEEVCVFTINGLSPSSGQKAKKIVRLDDLDASPFEARVETVEFFPLGRYRVEVRDQDGVSASEVRDTWKLFPLKLHQFELSDKKSLPLLQPLRPLPFGRGPANDRLLRGRKEVAINAKTPKGTVGISRLEFSWTIPHLRLQALWLYVFDDKQQIVWHAPVSGNRASYRGTSLQPGKIYHWILGGLSESHLLTFERLQYFRLASP